MVKNIGVGLLALILFLSLVYIMGPRVEFAPIVMPDSSIWETAPLSEFDSIIADRESRVADLKRDNHARIIWHDSTTTKTNISILYLHGFSASQEEGDPVHLKMAQRYGANMFLARLSDHGRSDSLSFQYLTPQALIDSAEEAFDIASRLGDTLIVMSCSTGSTLAAYIAAQRDDVYGMMMYSPNIDLYDPNSHLLMGPWGERLARLVFDGECRELVYDEQAKKYWNDAYHINGMFVVRDLIDKTMTNEVFEQLDMPIMLLYYYQDKKHFDDIVSIEAMHDFIEAINVDRDRKKIKALPNVGAHVMTSHIFSQDLSSVLSESFAFADSTLLLLPIKQY